MPRVLLCAKELAQMALGLKTEQEMEIPAPFRVSYRSKDTTPAAKDSRNVLP